MTWLGQTWSQFKYQNVNIKTQSFAYSEHNILCILPSPVSDLVILKRISFLADCVIPILVGTIEIHRQLDILLRLIVYNYPKQADDN